MAQWNCFLVITKQKAQVLFTQQQDFVLCSVAWWLVDYVQSEMFIAFTDTK